MKVVDKKYWYALSMMVISILFNLNVQASVQDEVGKSNKPSIVVDAKDIYNQPVVNLVICNDCSESGVAMANNAITQELLFALCENQLVLATKRLFHTLYDGYVALESKNVSIEYLPMQNLVQQYGYDVNILHKEVLKLSADLEYSNSFDVTCYAAYKIFLARGYSCKEVDQEHLIFIPQNLLADDRKQAIQDKFVKIAHVQDINKLGITLEDCSLGLRVSQLKNFDFTNPVFVTQLHAPISCGTISLAQVMSTLAIKPILLKKRASGLVDLLLPKMNVYLAGHGGYKEKYGTDTIAGVSCDIRPGQKNDFEVIVRLLNMQYVTRSLTIFSCFSGLNMNRLVNDFTKQAFFENVSYPILFSSGLFAMGYSTAPLTTFNVSHYVANIYDKEDLLRYIYAIKGAFFFGPKKENADKGSFDMLFEHLNHVKHYEVPASKIQKAYSYSAYQPEYDKAMNVLTSIFTDMGGVGYVNNVAFVRLPGTSWISAVDLGKRMQTITPTQGLTAQKGITIQPSVQILLLSAPYIRYTIRIAGQHLSPLIVPTLIDQRLARSNQSNVSEYSAEYVIEHVESSRDIIDLGSLFFDQSLINALTQGFSILIKQVDVMDSNNHKNILARYLNVLVWHRYLQSGNHVCMMFYQRADISDTTLQVHVYRDDSANNFESTNVIVYKELEYELLFNQIVAHVFENSLNSTEDASFSEALSPEQALPKKFDVLSQNVPLPQKVAKLNEAFGKIAKRSFVDVKKEQAFRQLKGLEDQLEERLDKTRKMIEAQKAQ